MLVLSRKVGESIIIDGNITVTLIEVDGHRVRLGFSAPDHVRIMRSELVAGTRVDSGRASRPVERQVTAALAELALSR